MQAPRTAVFCFVFNQAQTAFKKPPHKFRQPNEKGPRGRRKPDRNFVGNATIEVVFERLETKLVFRGATENASKDR
ncbi:MAG TPA: hypothetical protein VGG58_05055 [Candidatus Acidoferrum sp.]|jgi:hypothetical protein